MPSFKEIRDAANSGEGDKVNEHLDYLFKQQSKSQNKQFIISNYYLSYYYKSLKFILTILSLVL